MTVPRLPDLGSSADFSPCLRYRYLLRRIWDHSRGTCGFIMLNPSTADAQEDDPTIRRCIGFARRERLGGLVVANLFGYRATNPRELLKVADPTGPNNDTWVGVAARCELVILAWGATHERWAPRVARVDQVMGVLEFAGAKPLCLGVSLGGSPRHPLYAPSDSFLMEAT